jgi:hypothetical protein
MRLQATTRSASRLVEPEISNKQRLKEEISDPNLV